MGKSGDQRTRMTKQLIRNAFMDLLSRKPIQSISIRELCGIAGINRGTFYTHYKDIYDLLEQIEEEMTREIEKALEPLLSEGNKELTPLKITTEIFRCRKEYAGLGTVTLGDYGDKSFAVRLLRLGREKCVEAYSRFFALATPKEIEYFYAFASAGCIGLLEEWLREGMVTGAEEIAAMAEDMMMYGVGCLKKR